MSFSLRVAEALLRRPRRRWRSRSRGFCQNSLPAAVASSSRRLRLTLGGSKKYIFTFFAYFSGFRPSKIKKTDQKSHHLQAKGGVTPLSCTYCDFWSDFLIFEGRNPEKYAKHVKILRVPLRGVRNMNRKIQGFSACMFVTALTRKLRQTMRHH